MTKNIDALGNRMKQYEATTTRAVVFKGQPLIARLDGKSFHTFTRGLARPFDQRLRDLMMLITKKLVSQFNATIAFHQSDEITLVWYVPTGSATEYPFGGRVQKLESILAATASVVMNRHLPEFLPDKVQFMPVFDCRVFAVPNLTEAYNNLVWRQQDCVKNAISMAAQAKFSHRQLHGKTSDEKQEMLRFHHGINFNDYPYWFKRGAFVRKYTELRELLPEQLMKIPQQHRPTGPVERSAIKECDFWLTKMTDPLTELFS